VASAAFDGERQTRVSYVDPQVTPETRTVRVRADLPNPDGRLRLGMYVDVDLTTAQSSSGPVVPKAAIQAIGDRQVVYVAVSSAAGKFVEREVRPGAATGDVVQILEGLAAGESVVVEGAFFLRAERDRLGLGR
jgi:RND family efflux transporter MFP subunit